MPVALPCVCGGHFLIHGTSATSFHNFTSDYSLPTSVRRHAWCDSAGYRVDKYSSGQKDGSLVFPSYPVYYNIPPATLCITVFPSYSLLQYSLSYPEYFSFHRLAVYLLPPITGSVRSSARKVRVFKVHLPLNETLIFVSGQEVVGQVVLPVRPQILRLVESGLDMGHVSQTLVPESCAPCVL